MIYGTVEDFRLAFKQGDVDEFVLRTDTDLLEALESAASEINSYLPRMTISNAAFQILEKKGYFLARLFVYKDQALDISHPVVREAENVRKWLRYLSQGTVTLPGDDDVPKVGGIAGGTRELNAVKFIDKHYV